MEDIPDTSIVYAEKALPIADVLSLEPKLRDYLIQINPPKIDLGNASALRLYNLAVLRAKYDLNIILPEEMLIPTPGLRYSFLKFILSDFSKENRILEIGTGSSAIFAMLAAKCFDYSITATEMGAPISWARKNVQLNNLDHKINILDSQGLVLKGLPLDGSYSLIFSYPPLYPDIDAHNIAQKKRGFLGRGQELIGGGKYGENFIIQLINESANSTILHPQGILALLLVPNPERDQMIFNALREHQMDFHLTSLLAGTRRRIILKAVKT